MYRFSTFVFKANSFTGEDKSTIWKTFSEKRLPCGATEHTTNDLILMFISGITSVGFISKLHSRDGFCDTGKPQDLEQFIYKTNIFPHKCYISKVLFDIYYMVSGCG